MKLTISCIFAIVLAGAVYAEEARHSHHHEHHDDEWTWSSVWCPGSSWTSTKVRKVCCKTSIPCSTTASCTVPTETTTSVAPPAPDGVCQTITATLWDLVADTLIICNKFTTECPAQYADKATITFSIKAQGEQAVNSASGTGTNGMLIGAGLALAGIGAMFL